MEDLNKVLSDCCESEGSFDWMTLYLETKDGMYSKTFFLFKDLLNEITPRRGTVPDHELGIVEIQIDGEGNTITCLAVEILDYMRGRSTAYTGFIGGDAEVEDEEPSLKNAAKNVLIASGLVAAAPIASVAIPAIGIPILMKKMYDMYTK